MSYCRYAIISQAEKKLERFADRRRDANDIAVEFARTKGGVFFVARVVAATRVVLEENVRRRKR